MYVQQPPIDRVSSLCSDLSATIRLETTVPLFPPNRVSVAFVYTSSLFVPRKSSVGRARLTRTNWQNSANKHLLVTMLFSSFFFFFSSLDDRLATRANALPQSVAFASSIFCGYVSYTFTLERRFVLPHSALLDGQRKNELRDRREAGSYRLSPAPRDSIRMVAALLPARQHH